MIGWLLKEDVFSGEVPTREEVEQFIEVLNAVPREHLGAFSVIDDDEYTCVIRVRAWLERVLESGNLKGLKPKPTEHICDECERPCGKCGPKCRECGYGQQGWHGVNCSQYVKR